MVLLEWHNVLTISDRDIIHNNKSLNDLKGTNIYKNKLIILKILNLI